MSAASMSTPRTPATARRPPSERLVRQDTTHCVPRTHPRHRSAGNSCQHRRSGRPRPPGPVRGTGQSLANLARPAGARVVRSGSAKVASDHVEVVLDGQCKNVRRWKASTLSGRRRARPTTPSSVMSVSAPRGRPSTRPAGDEKSTYAGVERACVGPDPASVPRGFRTSASLESRAGSRSNCRSASAMPRP